MKKVVLILLFAAMVWGAYLYFGSKEKLRTITIGGEKYDVLLATTSEERSRGLMNRSTIGADGMLFVFPQSGAYTFWMKDVRFPLDIIWIEDDTVVHIVEQAKPSLTPPHQSYAPSKIANFVLELSGGTALRQGIQVGSKVQIEL